jgi:hypothetical protein
VDVMETAFQAAAEIGIPVINCGGGKTRLRHVPHGHRAS